VCGRVQERHERNRFGFLSSRTLALPLTLSRGGGVDELSLITGGAGFIGSHLAEDLVRCGRPVRVLDDFSTGLWSNLAHLDPTPELVEGSLTDAAAVAQAMHGVGVVYHLGALASVARSVENPAVSHAACATE